jgi:high affinity Mn2+ porin
MPEEANGFTFDRNFAHAHGQSLELEYDYSLFDRPGKVRVLTYLNNAHMGDYRETLADPAFNPDITQSRQYRIKFGFALNAEQKLGDDWGAFLRAGWSDGRTETFAFTEIDRSVEAGLSLQGVAWKRPDDTVGAAVVVNGLSSGHDDYLTAGGLGFILGDGALHYGPETILEVYYMAKLAKSLFLSVDYQFVDNPGYNRDRGPVSIFGFRVHVEF